MEKKGTKKCLGYYLLFTFLLTYIYEFVILFPTWKEIRSIAALRIAPVMFIPGIVALGVRLVTDEGFQNSYFHPRFRKGKRKYYAMAWFLPAALCLVGIVVYFLLFHGNYSPSMEFYMGKLREQGSTLSMEAAKTGVISSAIAGILLAPVLNIATCFGEEWGWRAYLLPKMRELLGLKKAVIITGVIWGLWHLPLTIMGHNYGLGYAGYPVTGILAMCIFCVVIGIFFAYIFVRTGSVFAPALAHGALNGFASLGIYFTKDGGNPFVGPSVTGIISGIPFIVLAVFCMRDLSRSEEEAAEIREERPKRQGKKEERREPQTQKNKKNGE